MPGFFRTPSRTMHSFHKYLFIKHLPDTEQVMNRALM